MRQLTNFIIVVLFTGLAACGQAKSDPAEEESQTELVLRGNYKTDLYAYLKDSLDTGWVRANPELMDTETSFFKKKNAGSYFITPIKISGHSIPFAWDNNLSILRFLLSNNGNIKTLRGTDADPNYRGIKVIWNQKLLSLIWVNDRIYEAPIKDWWLIGESDCPDTITFPTLSFGKQFDVPNALTNNLEGLAIIPFSKEFSKIKSSDVSLISKNGMILKGKAYDIDGDGINDAFCYNEEIDETTDYSRFYINIEGKWECKHVKLDEVCI